jgi:ketosteroid isomerase-like protein
MSGQARVYRAARQQYDTWRIDREDAMSQDAVAMVRAYYRAYEQKDRAAMERLLAADFHFTSPRDNRIDRAAYFARCWPHGQDIASFALDDIVPSGDKVFVTYDARRENGIGFRSCEVHSFRGGRIVAVDVYFGWDLPHAAAEGGFVA